jgi:hypothetical protein
VADSDTGEAIDLRALRMQIMLGSQYQGPVTTVMLTGHVDLSAAEVVETLLDPARHSELVGGPVRVGKALGSPVQLKPAEGEGYLMEWIEGSHVTFALHPETFPETHYATVTVMAKDDPGGGARLTLYQQGVPEALAPDLRAAWERDYVGTLQQAKSG